MTKKHRLLAEVAVTDPIKSKFWGFVDIKVASECWNWKKGTSKSGYGRFYVNRKIGQVYAHRFSWTFFHGEIPKGLCVLHRCDNPPCVNPRHLFIGTIKDNARDMGKKGRSNYQKYPQNIRRGEENNTSKLTKEQVLEIRNKYRPRKDGPEKYGICILSREYGVHKTTIARIVNRTTWSHL